MATLVGRSLVTMPAHLVLGPDPSQWWQLPDDVDVGVVRTGLQEAMEKAKPHTLRVVVRNQEVMLTVNCAQVPLAGVIELEQAEPWAARF